MLLRTDHIIVRRRVRRDLGDLSPLMESMRLHGLIHPILVNRNNELIAGERRLESAKRLGWKSVEVSVVNKSDELERLEVELDENLQRKGLNPDEVSDAFNRIDRLRNPRLLQRIWRAIIAFFRRLFGRS